MKQFAMAVIVAVCAGALYAQAPADKKNAAPEKKASAAAEKKDAKAAPANPVPAAKPAPKPAARQAEEAEEAMVMIDDRPDAAEGGRPATGAFSAEQDEPAVPGGLPAAYGQLRGVLTDAGRQILVFENPDDGEITFVQLSFGRTGVSWRRLDSIRRYGSEAGFN